MIGAQNINHHLNFISTIRVVQENRKKGRVIRFFLHPVDNAIGAVSACLADRLLLPVIVKVHSVSGRALIKASFFVSARFSQWLANTWFDPIPTSYLLKVGEAVEYVSRGTAGSTPINWPLLKIFDKLRIAIARHFYVLAKDFNTLLRIPGALRSYVSWTRITDPIGEVQTNELDASLQRGWVLIQRGAVLVSEIVLEILAKAVAIAALPLKHAPYLNRFVDWLSIVIDSGRNRIHQSVMQKAHHIIDSNETAVRRKIMAKIGVISVRVLVRQTLNISVKLLLSQKVYTCLEYGLEQVVDFQGVPEIIQTTLPVAVRVASFALLARTAIATIEKLDADFQQEFDTEAATFFELASLINRHNLPKVLSYIKARII